MAEKIFLFGSVFATGGTGLVHTTADQPLTVGSAWVSTRLLQIALATKTLALSSLA